MTASSSTTCAMLLAVMSLISPSSCVKSFQPEVGAEVKSQDAMGHAAPKVLKLERQSVMLPKSATRSGRRKNFYSAKLSVGEPARVFHVTFDLGGGTMVLPSETCKDPACLERRRYDRWTSGTAEDIQANGQLVQPRTQKTLLRKRDRGTIGLHDLDVGSGQVVGSFVRDKVCVRGEDEDAESEARCFPMAMLVANKMSDMPFTLEPYDGTVGLGLKGMSVSMEFNFLAAFQQGYGTHPAHGAFSNSFGLHLGGDDDGGEITFGGYDVNRLTHPLKWAPVADPQEGRWQVAISAIRIGNNTIEACRDRVCRAAIDYSASLLGVPSKLAGGLEKLLAGAASPSGFGNGCQHMAMPDIHLELENDVTLTVPSEDFVSDFGLDKGAISQASCKPHVTQHNVDDIGPDVFILGESTLRRYYTFFNADTLSVGFSLAAGSPKGSKNILRLGNGKKGKAALDDENPVILLVQVKLLRSKTISSLN